MFITRREGRQGLRDKGELKFLEPSTHLDLTLPCAQSHTQNSACESDLITKRADGLGFRTTVVNAMQSVLHISAVLGALHVESHLILALPL